MSAPGTVFPPRDRDENGRARNNRPRDGLGRPLPRGSVGVGRMPDELFFEAAESLVQAQALLDEGLPFHAHEVLEASWKAALEGERELWQGLAQLAVGLTHVLRGNVGGGLALLDRGVGRIAGYGPVGPHRVDVLGLLAWVDSVASRVDGGGVPPTPMLCVPAAVTSDE